MPDVLTRHCAFCGAVAEGLNGPVETIDPNSQDDPPGSGWHKHAGPSYGMGFPRMEFYCSDECLDNRALKKQEPTRLLLPFERTWTAQKPVRVAKGANAKPKPKTLKDATRRAELAEATLTAAEERMKDLEANLDVAAAREQVYQEEVERLEASHQALQNEKEFVAAMYQQQADELEALRANQEE